MEKTQKVSNYCPLRVKNLDTLNLINELSKTNGNRNAILNEALDIGVPLLYARIMGKDVKEELENATTPSHTPSVARELKELRRVIDGLFVEMNVQEMLLAGLFNAKVEELDGNDVNAEQLRSGFLSFLPDVVDDVKSEIDGDEWGSER